MEFVSGFTYRVIEARSDEAAEGGEEKERKDVNDPATFFNLTIRRQCLCSRVAEL